MKQDFHIMDMQLTNMQHLYDAVNVWKSLGSVSSSLLNRCYEELQKC